MRGFVYGEDLYYGKVVRTQISGLWLFVSEVVSCSDSDSMIIAFCVRSYLRFGLRHLDFPFLCPKLPQVRTQTLGFSLFESEVVSCFDSDSLIYSFCVRSCSRFKHIGLDVPYQRPFQQSHYQNTFLRKLIINRGIHSMIRIKNSTAIESRISSEISRSHPGFRFSFFLRKVPAFLFLIACLLYFIHNALSCFAVQIAHVNQ